MSSLLPTPILWPEALFCEFRSCLLTQFNLRFVKAVFSAVKQASLLTLSGSVQLPFSKAMPAGLGEVVQAKKAFFVGSKVNVSIFFLRGRTAPVTVPAALPAFSETTEQVAAAFCCRLLARPVHLAALRVCHCGSPLLPFFKTSCGCHLWLPTCGKTRASCGTQCLPLW